MDILSGPYQGKTLYVCDVCVHKIRLNSFKAGMKAIHLNQHTTVYAPDSEAEGTKNPFEE